MTSKRPVTHPATQDIQRHLDQGWRRAKGGIYDENCSDGCDCKWCQSQKMPNPSTSAPSAASQGSGVSPGPGAADGRVAVRMEAQQVVLNAWRAREGIEDSPGGHSCAFVDALADAGLLCSPDQSRAARLMADVRDGAGWTCQLDGVIVAQCDTYGQTEAERRLTRERDEARVRADRKSSLAADNLRRAEQAEAERDEVAVRLSELLCDLTGGRLSKPTYSVATMAQEIEDHLAQYADEDLRRQCDDLLAMKARVEALAEESTVEGLQLRHAIEGESL